MAKELISLGVRRRAGGSTEPVSVTPDITIKQADHPQLIIDAKYKTRFSDSEATTLRIDPADLYESLAFLEATSIQRAILLYPMPSGLHEVDSTPGQTLEFDRITVGTRQIHGVAVHVSGISNPGGFRRFSESLSGALRGMIR
ncbi:MAG: hypothetical protein IH793_06275 [Acidobacteria bacterium]|nr:hypothetical protein [Acidobacteriota bacterium]